MMGSKAVRAALLAVTMCVAACTPSQEERTMAERASGLDVLGCRVDPIAASLRAGIARETITAALEGDQKAAWQAFKGFLANAPEPDDDEGACLTMFWADIAAQNGSVQAAYELATNDGTTPLLCLRSRFWAKQALARLGEFRGLLRADVAPADVEAHLERRKQQLTQALSRTCALPDASG